MSQGWVCRRGGFVVGWVCRRGTFVAGVRLSLGYVCRGVGLSQGGFVAGRVSRMRTVKLRSNAN